MRPLSRVGLLVSIVIALLVGSSGVAAAATSHQIIRHAAGNWAGEVWFNSGTHNPSKGRNSFTVKDSFCGDGWRVGVEYQISALGSFGTVKANVDCAGETSRSVAGDVPRSQIRWRGFKISTTSGAIEYESWVTDYVD